MTPLGQSLPPLIIPTRAALATSLGVRLAKINYWLYKVPSDARYRSFQLARTGGRPPRTIEAPIKPIKDIQRRLLRLLEGQYRPHYGAHGYIAGRSIATNARIHVGQRWLLRVDLTDFFTSINFGRVRGLFLARPFSFPPEVATLVAHICCHKNHLPQGAPTSPLVSNLVCRRLDMQLGELAVTERCFYTRYCDDITFSTNRRTFPASLASSDPQTGGIVAGSALNSTVSANGFAINPTKTRLRSYSQRQVVTGLVTNKFVNVPRAEVRSLRTLL
jgi:RNA-directed DNA polymerase